jgi:uncharacterized protein
VAGIGPGIASQIVKFRKEKGLFKRREDLTKVPSFGSKAYEQAAGFLRIVGGEVPLDSTGVHPERYSAVRDMAKEIGENVSQLFGQGAAKLKSLREKWSGLIGEFTFDDIVNELQKPGRDPRDPFKVFQFRDDIFGIEDLKEGMICNGIVSNVTNFGAFVDIGVHQDGLVHISEIGNQFVNDPQKVLSPGDQVQVQVKAVDKEKKQISLTMKFGERAQSAPRPRAPRSAGERSDRPRSAKPAGAKGRGKPAQGGKDRKSGGGAPQVDRPRRPPAQPFNNPFAALTQLKKGE